MDQKREPRWVLRLENFSMAVKTLRHNAELVQRDKAEFTLKQALFFAFLHSYELAWNLLKDYIEWDGRGPVVGSRTIIRTALNLGVIMDGDIWVRMIEDRNSATHLYRPANVEALEFNICNHYLPKFIQLEQFFIELSEQQK